MLVLTCMAVLLMLPVNCRVSCEMAMGEEVEVVESAM